MQLRTVTPHPAIAPYIHHFWVFESANGLPAGDARVVVPNGRHKLIIPYRNGLSARSAAAPDGGAVHHPEGAPVVVGLWEEPSIIASSAQPTCSIGVELLPNGLTRFLSEDAQRLTQRIVPLADVLGPVGERLGQRVVNAATADDAVELVQAFLCERLAGSPEPPGAVAAALRLLERSGYRMEVNELERRMGYSRRYLHALFLRHVGLAPKRLTAVLAFERLYRRFSQSKSPADLKRDALDVFYDQSHFIRTFRRYTGFSPGRFAELDNEFGRIFYRAVH